LIDRLRPVKQANETVARRLIFAGERVPKRMLSEENDLGFVRHATAELAISFTDARDHNLHAAFNGLIKAIETDRKRIAELEEQIKKLKPEAQV
jgi:hypothetical protein